MKWRVEFDGEWVPSNDETLFALHRLGYSAGAVREEGDSSTINYFLVRLDHYKSEITYETESQEELNNFINLILPPRS